MSGKEELIGWLRKVCAEYVLEPMAVYRKHGEHDWPLVANNEDALAHSLEAGGHFLPLPKEPAALANIIEVSLVSFILERLDKLNDAHGIQGTERGYPDLEISGRRFCSNHHALDVKVARRAKSGNQTQSRITLYTGNTYFRYPKLQWSGTFRPFQDYASHLNLIALYTLNKNSIARIEELELIVQESWRIGSRKRSSTTREYIGAVTSIAHLKAGEGQFATEEDFYIYWRKFPFNIGRAVQQKLDRFLAQQSASQKNDYEAPCPANSPILWMHLL